MGINEFIQIGNQIKKMRVEKGYSQKEMSKITGIPYSTYSNYENNNREPNAEQLKKIAKALDASISELYGEGFTTYDRRFISDFIDKSPLVREWFIENGLKSKEKNLKRIQGAYEHLNNEGRKEAAKRIEELTEIERYTKQDEWFKGRPTKEEIDKALTAYLNDDNPDEPPQD